MRIVSIIAAIVGVAVLAVLLYAATRPNSFRIQRSIVVDAPPAAAFALVNDFHRWTEWSPYEHIDADLKRTYGGAPAGVGATYAYEGAKAGQGRMEIVESSPQKVRATLAFLKPMTAENMAEFTFTPKGDGTVVTWAMYGPSPYISKLMGLAFNIDKMVGADFEKGLANLKAAAEK